MKDSYHTISGPSDSFYKEKGSKFYGFAFPVKSVEEVELRLGEVAKKFHDARHICYAYRFGVKGEPWRANDDGEPSHSAGDPILNEMKSKEVSDALVAVVRYFGGTKLGVGGLVRAYGTAAKEALAANTIVEVVLTQRLTIRYPYSRTSEINRIMHKHRLKPAASEFTADCRQSFDIRENDFEKITQVFAEIGIFIEK